MLTCHVASEGPMAQSVLKCSGIPNPDSTSDWMGLRSAVLNSKVMKELREMAFRLPAWRFLLLSMIALLVAAGYLAGNVPWDKVL